MSAQEKPRVRVKARRGLTVVRGEFRTCGDLAAKLRDFADRAEKGEFVGGAVALVRHDGGATAGWEMGRPGRSHALIGAVYGLLHRMGCIWEDD